MNDPYQYEDNFNTRMCGFRVRMRIIVKMSRPNHKKHPDAFLVQLLGDVSDLRSVANKRGENINFQSSNGWVEVAHSDHNPNSPSGHDIYDANDNKQLHVDVQDPENSDNYKNVIKKIANGSPDKPTGKALSHAEKYIRKKMQ